MTSRHVRDLLDGGYAILGGFTGLGIGAGWAVLVAGRIDGRAGRRAVAAAGVVSLLSAGAAYACTPDTELARSLVGLVAGTAAVAVAAGLDWWWPSVATSGALVVIAVVDGADRASAVVATVAIALVHAAAQVAVRRVMPPATARLVAVVAVVAVAVAVCSRVAGLAATAERALAVAGITGAVAVVALASVAAHRPSPGG